MQSQPLTPHARPTPNLTENPSPNWGKSAALRWFGTRVRIASVPSLMTIERSDWERDPHACLRECDHRFGQVRLAVRSDARVEDRLDASHAGRFLTLLDIDRRGLRSSVDRVLGSLSDADDGVMLQPMVDAVRYSAVASTHRVDDGAPWYCIDLAAGDCAAVTDGRSSGRQVAIARNSVCRGPAGMEGLSPAAALVLATLLEVEALAGSTPLEIEVVLTDAGDGSFRSHLLQVRPVLPNDRWPRRETSARLPLLKQLATPDPLSRVVGRKTVLSLMSDWNPAELLGTHPRPLALSLFQWLIGRGVWWRARACLGYRAPPHARIALLSVVRGRPFVDVRRSANSLLPEGLPATTQAHIVDAWLERLHTTPELHDKVEFAVYRTTRDFASASSLRAACSGVLGAADATEWERSLGVLTAAVMQGAASAPRLALRALESASAIKQDWPALLIACRRGTLGFAALARIAFIAEAQVRSAIERGALSADRARALRASSGVVAQLLGDVCDGAGGHESPSHLRPGTFEITQDTWIRPRAAPGSNRVGKAREFALDSAETRALTALLREARLPLDARAWTRFVAGSIHHREWGKFVFTRYLSAALDDIGRTAERAGLDRECASWLTLDQLRRGGTLTPRIRSRYWREAAATAASRYLVDSRIVLGPVLRSVQDRHLADSLGVLPNFVGGQAIGTRVVHLDANARPSRSLRGAIVTLRNADPGFDWLFDCGIAGLITAWGGANSHMAIRCAEFGLTAAIGCGEAVFARALNARSARIDPLGGALWLD